MLSSLGTDQLRSNGPGIASRPHRKIAERPVLDGLIPQVVVIEEGEQVSWISDAGNLRVEFDVNSCKFSSNVVQAPDGQRLIGGTTKPCSMAATSTLRHRSYTITWAP